MSVQGSFAAVARDGGRAALVTVVAGPHLGARLLVRADGRQEGALGDAQLRENAVAHAQDLMWTERSEMRGELFVDVTAPPPRLLIFGAIAYASDLARLARVAGWRPFVIDPRARFATRARFPDAVEVVVAWPGAALQRLGAIDRATYVAVLSNDPKIDDAVLLLALSAEPAYVGAMGSRHAQAKRSARLRAAGASEDDLNRISAPVGLDLGALTAAETALSVMAEVVAVRHGREGGRLSARRDGRDPSTSL